MQLELRYFSGHAGKPRNTPQIRMADDMNQDRLQVTWCGMINCCKSDVELFMAVHVLR